METRETFIVTLFCDPRRNAEPSGRLRHVASSQEATFRALDELTALLRGFARDGAFRGQGGADNDLGGR